MAAQTIPFTLWRTNVPGVQVIRNNCNAGFARAVNDGIAQASAEFILLLNNDARLEPGALRAFADGFDTLPNLAIAGGQLRNPDGRLQSAFAPLPTIAEEILPLFVLRLMFPGRFRRKTFDEHPVAVESVLGACFCVRSSALSTLGFLDEDYFFYFEEIDWCRRAGQMGADVYYLPTARAVHQGGRTANRFRGPARVEYQRSKLTYFRKSRDAEFLTLLLIRSPKSTRSSRRPSPDRLDTPHSLTSHEGIPYYDELCDRSQIETEIHGG